MKKRPGASTPLRIRSRNRVHRLSMPVCLVAIAAVCLAAAQTALAANPFGVVPPDGGGSFAPSGGFFGWIAAQQAAFYRLLVGTMSEMKVNGSAAWTLIGISFLYGVFHAAGPGRGKTVITSYLLASRETMQKGIIIAFAAALVQGLTAIAVVLTAVLILGTTSMAMTQFANWLEVVSFGLVAAMGASLLWQRRPVAAISIAMPATVAARIAMAGTITIIMTTIMGMGTTITMSTVMRPCRTRLWDA
jgi:nickel/cobalt exporter